MNNDSDRDGNSSGDLVVEPAAPMGDRAVTNPGRNETRCEHMGSIPATHTSETGGDTGPSHLRTRVLVREGSCDLKERSEKIRSTEDRRSPDERAIMVE
ncbi:hypothetical protein LWI29_015836 [Acer saccharum]|uniref:Uncharacterized protein n=1 Tax=Acer saccharum TaxID=4024 RepID=A0AA39SLX0_ACESA|nr:hypothetical protein LWI29_015836 [Acer saccharum]